MEEMRCLQGKTLLITGGTGSFGNAVLRRFLHSSVKEIRVFSRDEKKQEDMRIELDNAKVKFYLGNVRDDKSLEFAMDGVDYLFPRRSFEAGAVMRILPYGGGQDKHSGGRKCVECSYRKRGV